MSMEKSDTTKAAPLKGYFCPRPFEFATINDKGEIYLCCPGWLKVAAGSMDGVTFDEVWNSNYAEKMRASILDGTYSYCNDNCPYLKTRAGILKRFEDVTNPWHREIIEKGLTRLDRGPREITVSHDPTCNLSCPSCRREMFKHGPGGKERSARINEQVFNEAIKDAELIEICGNGDPFASPLYLDALRNFDRTRFPNLRIGLVTNGLRLDAKMWDSIAASHSAISRIHISWNGARPETFAANQRGGQLDKLLENMAFIATLRASGAIPFMSFGFYVQRNNFQEMAEMLPLARRFHADAIYFTPVSKSIAHTDEEFADHAVHRPGHSEFEAFREVLNSPAMNDPLVHLINLEHLLYVAREEDGIAPATKFAELQEPISGAFTLESFSNLLRCTDEQRARLRCLLNRLKERSVLILARPSVGGDPSPLAYLQQQDMADEDRVLAAFRDYALQHVEPSSGLDYWNAIHSMVQEAFPEIHQILSVVQRRIWDRCNMNTLLDIDTGYDPLALFVQYEKGALADAPPPWIVIRERLGLEETRAALVLGYVEAAKDRITALLAKPDAVGGPSPLERLASWMRQEPAQALEQFRSFLVVSRPESCTRPYVKEVAAVIQDVDFDIRALLSADETGKLDTFNTISWNEVRSDYDPMDGALKALLAQPAPALIWDGTWESLARGLGLRGRQADESLAILLRAKAEAVALLSEAAQGGKDSPLDMLALALQRQAKYTGRAFLAYVSTMKSAQSGQRYAAGLLRWEEGLEERLCRLLTAEQVHCLQSRPKGGLLQLRVAQDPFQEAVRRKVEALSLQGATAKGLR